MTEKHSETLKTVINEFAGKTISNQEIELLSSIGIKKMLKPKIYFKKNPNAYMSPMKQTDHITNFKKSEATLKKCPTQIGSTILLHKWCCYTMALLGIARHYCSSRGSAWPVFNNPNQGSKMQNICKLSPIELKFCTHLHKVVPDFHKNWAKNIQISKSDKNMNLNQLFFSQNDTKD